MPFIWSRKIQQPSSFSWANDLRSYDQFYQEIQIETYSLPPKITLYDEHHNLINSSKAEYPEQALVHEHLDETATVLELGARYGSVSCVINKKLINKSNQISVEPDSTVWSALERNIVENGCDIILHKGFVSKKSLSLIPMGYASTAVETTSSTIPSVSVEELQLKYNLKFDTLVADCEGFLETFFDENPHLYDQLHTVIFEADFPNKCNYDKIRTELKSHGFREVIHGFQNVYKK
jgi:FkbM family methyltransferase